jgi:hypothetical protein
MSGMKRFAFVIGFILGLLGFVLIVGNVLLYLLTGKLPSVETGENGRPVFGLMTPEDVATTIREQVERERAKRLGAR